MGLPAAPGGAAGGDGRLTAAFACPLCRSADLSVYLDGRDDTLDAASVGSSRQSVSPGRILRCRGCRFGFREARAAAHELAEIYRQMDSSVYEAELRGRARTARRHLAIVERYARRGRILDAGCASGLFLAGAADAGWEVTGIEPAEALFQRARAALDGRGQVLPATLETAGLPEGYYDAITLWDVLEHVPDPLTVMKRCRALLKPGGHLFLNVPDLDSLAARLLGRRWPLLLAEHLNYFNRESLRWCGEHAGLTWLRFGRRRVFFSVEYVAYRLSQHGIRGARLVHRLARGPAGGLLIPVSMGETYGVWQR